MEELREQLQGNCKIKFNIDASNVHGFDLFDEYSNHGTYFSKYDLKEEYLSPIQEYSEPSSSDGSSDRIRSLSCHELSSCALKKNVEITCRSQTYPRTHADETISEYNQRTHIEFPWEPREIDPDLFFQLHAADSQEELQEFLLLESQCMNSDNQLFGLHAAFSKDSKK